MGRPHLGLVVAFWLLAWPAASYSAEGTNERQNWSQWRGPLATGVAIDADPPVVWGENKNIRWKAALPGKGHSTPVIWGDRIYVTTAVPIGDALPPRFSTAPGTHDGVPVTHRHQFLVLALNRRDGTIVWKRTLHEKLPHEGGHYTGSLASNSAAIDGEYVFAFFGSHGLFCLTTTGELKWSKQFGEMQTKHGHGEGNSPVLHGDLVFINWDHDGKSWVMALDKATGNERWKVDRDEQTSWATPIVVEHAGRPQLVVSGTNRVRGYDAATGKLIWECGGLASNIVASPVAGGGMIFAGSSYEKRSLLAIRLDGAKGDITGTDNVAWSRVRGTPYVPSPLLYGDSLYFLAHYQGIIARVNAKTGEDEPGSVRLTGIGNIYASPVAAADRVYITDLDGATIVLNHKAFPRVLALNKLDDEFSASAAIAGREIFLRGQKHLYCIANRTP